MQTQPSMQPAVVAAIIGAAGAIAAALIGAFVAIRNNKQKLEKEHAKLTDSIQDHISSYGFKAESAYSHAEVDCDGNSSTTRGWRGLAVASGFTLAHMPQKVWVGTPGAKILRGPMLTKNNNFPKDIFLFVTKRTDQECEYQLEVTGGLTSSDPPLDAEVRTEYSQSVLMYLEQVEAAYRNDLFRRDYHSYDVEFPIDFLELQVHFPENHPVSLFGGVFYSRSEVQNDLEWRRIQPGFKRTNNSATLKVTRPKVGLRYFIYWTPPTRPS